MKDWFRRIDLLEFFLIMLVLLLCLVVFAWSQDALGQEAPAQQYLEFPNFTGGLNLSRIGQIQPNQALRLENFLLDEGEIRVRNGYGHISDEFNTSGVEYLGLYRQQGTAGKLIVKSGTKLYIVNRANVDTVWTDDEYTQLFVITGTVNKGDSASFYLYSANENTKFESYAFNSIQLDSSTQTSHTIGVDYAVNDTTLKLTDSLPEKMTGWTYSVPVAIGNIVSGETFVDSFYMATSTGKLRYNDSTLLGTQTQQAYRFVPARATMSGQHARYYAGAMTTGTISDALQAASSGTAFAKISLRQTGLSGSLLDGEIYYLTTPIISVQWEDFADTFSILTVAGEFPYDTTGAKPIVSIVEMDIDQSTAFTVYVDSLIYRTVSGIDSITTTPGTFTEAYIVMVDDSLMSGKDSTFFASGDWFYSLGTSATDNATSRRAIVVGNYLDDSLRVFLTIPYRSIENFTVGTQADTIDTNQPVTFFRRTIRPASSGGFVAGTFWNDRWCLVSDSTTSQIDFSEDFEPLTSSGYLVQVNPDDGEPILWLKQMYGTLIIGKNSSIWKLTGVPGLDAFATLSRAIDGLSFVAPKSIVTYNNLMFGLGSDGFYVYDYNSMIKISQQIESIVQDSINWDRADQVVGGYFDNHFWWSYPSRGSINNDRTLCYNPQLKAWTTSTMDFGAVFVDGGVNDSDNVYLGDATTGKVYLYGSDNDDDGTAISANLSTGWFNMGTDWHDKIVNRGLLTNHRRSSTSLSLSLTCVREEGTSQTVARTFTSTPSNYRGLSRAYFNVDQLRGAQYQLNITATTADSLRIGNVGLEYQVESVGY